MSLTAYASLKTPHCGVFRAFGAPSPILKKQVDFMKITLIGQDIPTLLPTLLADLLFAARVRDAEIALEEKNPAMGAVLQSYGDAIFRQAGLGGRLRTETDREGFP